MRFTVLLLSVSIFLARFHATAQTFNGSGGAVPGTSTSQTCFSLNVTGLPTSINTSSFGLTQVCIKMTHANTSEVEIVLTAPDGTTVPLTIQNPGANYTNTCFSATAPTLIKFGTSPYSGTYLPEGFLGAVNNGQNPNGTWRICVQDRRNGAVAGTFNSWSLTFGNTPAPAPPAFPNCAQTLTGASSCANATAVCDFDGLCGNTALNTVQDWSGSGLNTCFGLENNSFIKFVAAAPTVSFAVWVPTTSGTFLTGGIQMLFFSGTCGSGPVTSYGCYPHIFPYTTTGSPLITNVEATGLTIGNTYYLMIDGFGGASSSFRIAATSGVNIFAVAPTSATICNGQSVNLTASGANGIYSWAPPAGLNATSGATVTASPNATTTYTVTSSSVGGCPLTKNVTVSVTNPVTPVTTFSYSSGTVCANGTNPTLNPGTGFTTGGTFSATPAGLGLNATTGAINLASSTPGTYTITYNVAASGCNPAGSGTTTLTVTPVVPPTTSFSYSVATVCANGTNPALNPATGFTTGGTFSATPAGLGLNATTGAIDLTSSTPGTYTITYSVAASGCNPAGSGTTTLTITPVVPPTTSFSYSVATVCANGTNPTLNPGTGFTTGGTFSATPAGLGLNATTGTIDLTSSTPGTYTITYSVAASGCNPAGSSNTTLTIQPNTTPVTTFSYSVATVCANGTNPTLNPGTGFTNGGTFSATPAGLGLNTTTGAIDLTSSTPGTYSITYTIPASGCNVGGSSNTTLTIQPNTTPVTSFSYSVATVCANGTNPTLNPGTGFTTGGSFSATPAGLGLNTTTGAIDLSASTPGSYSITYTIPASGCNVGGSSNTTLTIQPNTTPVTSFSYSVATVCANGTNPALNPGTGFTTGGTFSATPTGLGLNTTTGAIDLTSSTPGTYSITYTIPASGCNVGGSSNTTLTIQPNTTPVTSFSYSVATVCANGTNPTLNPGTGFTTGGTFSATPAGLGLNTTTGAIDLSASTPGSYSITYTIPASGCNVGGSSNTTLTIQPNTTPVTSFSYSVATVCANGTNPALNPGTGFTNGGTFSATPAGLGLNTTTGAIDLTSSTPGTYSITYTIPASGCNVGGSSNTTLTIQPNTTPVTSFSYSVATVCANGTNPTLNPGTGFTTGGTFSATPTGLGLNATTGAINLTSSTPGTYSITYTIPANGCNVGGSSNTTLTIQPNTTPVTSFSYSVATVCANGTNPTLNPGTGFTTGGTFSATPTGLGLNATTGAIDLTSSTPGSYSITYAVAASGCQSAANSGSTLQIIGGTTPVTTFSYSVNRVCSNGSNPVLQPGTGFVTGGQFTSIPAGLVIDQNTGSINVASSTPGTYSISYTIAAVGCSPQGSSTFTLTIDPNTFPVTAFSYNPTGVCTNGSNPVLVPATGFTTGGTFTVSPSGLNLNATTGAITVAGSSINVYTITYSVAASGCRLAGTSITNFGIGATITPVTSFSYSPASFCKNGTAPNLIKATGFDAGGSFSATPAGLSLDATTGSINTGLSQPGTYQVTYSRAASGCYIAGNSSFTVTVLAVPVVVTGFHYSSQQLCSNDQNPILQKDPGFTEGGTYAVTPAGLNLNSSSGAINLSGSAPGNYTITYTVPAGTCAPASSASVTLQLTASQTGVTGFSYSPASVCASTATTSLQQVAGFTAGGTFTATPAGLSIDAFTGAINIAASVPGNYSIRYDLPGITCRPTAFSTTNFTYLQPGGTPVTKFAYVTDSACTSDGQITVQPASGFSTGGLFTALPSGLSLNQNSGQINPSLSIPGIYQVIYTIAATPCSPAAADTVLLTIVRTPGVPLVQVDDPVTCGPRVVHMEALGAGSFWWYSDETLNDLLQNGASITFTATETGSVYVVAREGRCESMIATATAVVNPLPIKPDLGADTLLCPDQHLTLNAGAYDQYLWQDGSSFSTFEVNASGLFWVEVTDQYGCTARDTIAVNRMDICQDIFFPGAISPDGDGHNDRFGPMGDLFLITEFELQIFDRYGRRVYASNNPYQRWDGGDLRQRKGAENYVWYAQYKFRGMKKLKKGNLLLVR